MVFLKTKCIEVQGKKSPWNRINDCGILIRDWRFCHYRFYIEDFRIKVMN